MEVDLGNRVPDEDSLGLFLFSEDDREFREVRIWGGPSKKWKRLKESQGI